MLPEDPVPDVHGREPAGGLGRCAAAAAQVGQPCSGGEWAERDVATRY